MLNFLSLCSVALEKTFYRTVVFVSFLITVTKSLMEMPKGRKDLALAYSFRRFILLSFGPMSGGRASRYRSACRGYSSILEAITRGG